MRRDMDVIRRMALALEEPGDFGIGHLDGIDDATFKTHARWLIEAGLAHGHIADSGTQSRTVPERVRLHVLTWAGCEFVQAVRDDTLWRKAKDHVIKPSASWTFEVLLKYLRLEIGRHVPGLEQLL